MDDKSRYIRRFFIAEISFVVVIAIILFNCYIDFDFFRQLFLLCIKAFMVGTILNLLLCFIFYKTNK